MSQKYNNSDITVKKISYQAERISDGLAFFDFLDPAQQILITKELKQYRKFEFKFFGGHAQCERKMLCISTDPISTNMLWPMLLCRANIDFNADHQAVLGSTMSLGIKRETIGDIIIDDESIQIVAKEPIAKYIALNLDRINNRKLCFDILDISKINIKETVYKEELINVNSLRLDGVISAAYGISRNVTDEIIKKGGVKINHLPVNKVSKSLDSGDLISVRGKGRFILDSVVGTTKKGRNKVLVKKYT